MNSLDNLKENDLDKIVHIRNEAHTVVEAINRQLTHYAMHIGQIIFLSKHFCGQNWKTLSIAKGKSAQFNEQMFKKNKNT